MINRPRNLKRIMEMDTRQESKDVCIYDLVNLDLYFVVICNKPSMSLNAPLWLWV